MVQKITAADAAYAIRFYKALDACDFTWCNYARIRPEFFPGETFEPTGYSLEYAWLPPNTDHGPMRRGYDAADIKDIVLGWKKNTPTILGGASAGDGLFLAREVNTGRTEHPSSHWVICPGSSSVDGEILSLRRSSGRSRASVHSKNFHWSDSCLVLIRKVYPPQTSP